MVSRTYCMVSRYRPAWLYCNDIKWFLNVRGMGYVKSSISPIVQLSSCISACHPPVQLCSLSSRPVAQLSCLSSCRVFQSFRCPPGGPLLRYVLTCLSKNSQKRVPFSEWGSDLSRSEERVSFLSDLGNKGTFLSTIFIVWSHFGIFLKKYSPCNGHSKLFMLPFRDKGIVLMLILETPHAQILDKWFTSGLRVSF